MSDTSGPGPRLLIEQGDVLVEAATFWRVSPDAFVIAMTLREKHAAGELITSGALQQFSLYTVPGVTSREGAIFPEGHARRDTLVTLNEPGWLLDVEVSRYTAVITGVRNPFGNGQPGQPVELVVVSAEAALQPSL